MKKNDVSIIIVSYNTAELTKNCIKSIYEKTIDLDFEVIVVDNNSQDGSAEMIKENFPQVKLIKNTENKGFGAANNIAIKQSDSKYVFLLNPDTLLINNAIKILYDFMESNPSVGACGGVLYDKDNKKTFSYGNFPSIKEFIFKFGLRNVFKKFYNRHLSQIVIPYKDEIYEVDYISGADLFIRKNILDKIGLFDENYFMYYEETDLQLRIKKQGFNIKLMPNAKIIHLEGKSFSQNINRKIKSKKSEMYYYRKNKGFINLLFIKLFFIIAYLVLFLFLRKTDYLKIIKTVIKS